MKTKLFISALSLAAFLNSRAQNFHSGPVYVGGLQYDASTTNGSWLASGGSLLVDNGGTWMFNDAIFTTPRTSIAQSSLINFSGGIYNRTTGFVNGYVSAEDRAAGFVFPIGQAAYMPVTVTTALAAGNPLVAAWYDAKPLNSVFIVTPGSLPGGSGSGAQYDFLPGYYDFSSTAAGNKVQPTVPSGTGSNTRLVGTADGSTFIDLGAPTDLATLPAGAYQLRWANKGIILPLTLTEFAASKQGSNSLLSWKVSMEQNVSNYTIERSTDGRSFTAVGTVMSLGNTAQPRTYALLDAQPAKGANYYRLKMVEKDGKVTYSAIRILNFNANMVIAVYPNPVVDKATLTGLEAGMQVVIVNTGGQRISTQKATTSTLEVPMKHLTPAMYNVHVYDPTGKLISINHVIKE